MAFLASVQFRDPDAIRVTFFKMKLWNKVIAESLYVLHMIAVFLINQKKNALGIVNRF